MRVSVVRVQFEGAPVFGLGVGPAKLFLPHIWREEYARQQGQVLVPSTTLNGRDTIAELPDGNNTCSAACTYIGATGTEILAPYFLTLYNGVLQHGQYDETLFYEFGRSFWSYGSQLGTVDPFVTGFAIANNFLAAATTATGRNYGFLFKGEYAGS